MRKIWRLIYRPPVFLYEHLISRKRGSLGFVILEFFLLGFVMARAYVYFSRLGWWPQNFMTVVVGQHIHHFAWGIILVVPVGLAYMLMPERFMPYWRLKLAAIYGWGMGLIFDQFGMWINLTDNYSLRTGYDAVVILAGILINGVYFKPMWKFLYQKTLKKVIE